MTQNPAPRPTSWAELPGDGSLQAASNGLELIHAALLDPERPKALHIEADGARHSSGATCARADAPMPVPTGGIHYFESTILAIAPGGIVALGFCGQQNSLQKLPGWEPASYAYHGDSGHVFTARTSGGREYGPGFMDVGDVVGCGVYHRLGERTAFFTKNGVELGTAFENVRPGHIFPCIGMKEPGAHVRTNFGEEAFLFDLESWWSTKTKS